MVRSVSALAVLACLAVLLPVDEVAAAPSSPSAPAQVEPPPPPPDLAARYSAAVLADAPVRYFRLDQLSGATALDSSSQLQDGQYQAGVELGLDGALPGTSDADLASRGPDAAWDVLGSSQGLPTGNSARTVEMWIQTTTAGGWLAQYGNGFGLYLNAGNQVRVYRSWNCCSDYISATTPRPVNDGAWHHLAVTYDGATVTWYFDGAAFSRQGTSFGTSLSAGLSVGALAGTYDEVAVYGAALPAETIAARWANGATAREVTCDRAATSAYGIEVQQDAPLAYYPLDDLAEGDDRVADDLGAGCQHASVASVGVPADGAALTGGQGIQNPDTGWGLTASGADLPTGNGARTAELWVRTGAADGWLAYYGNGWGVYLTGGNQVRVYRSWNCCNDYVTATTPRPVNDGAWHHLVVTFDGSTLTWYFDGAAFSRQGTSFGTARSTGLTVGALPADLDEVALYGSALSPARVAAHWSRGASRRDPDCPAPAPTGAYAASVLADAPLAYYRVGDRDEDPDTRVAVDSSGGCQHGALAVASAASPGALVGDPDGAFSKSDTGWGLLASGSNLPTGNGARSVELWVQTTASDGWLAYYGNGWGLYLAGGNQLRVHRSWNCCSDYISATAPRPVNDGAWHHLAVTYEAGAVTWYFDGAAFSRQGTSFGTALSTGLTVGAIPGRFDEVAVYGTALSPARVASHWSLGASHRRPDCPAPVPTGPYAASVLADAPLVYHRLGERVTNDPATRVAVDSSGGCQHGALAVATTASDGALVGDPDGGFSKTDTGWGLLGSGSNLPTGNGARSVELWVQTTASDGWLAYYGNGFGLYLTGGSQVRVHRSWNCCSDYISASTPRPVNDGEWHHLVMTYDGGTVTWYFDGAAFSRQGTSLNTALSTGLTVGAIPGSFDEVAVYGAALSPARVADHWARGASSVETPCGASTSGHAQTILDAGPVAYYRVGELADDPDQRVALDSSPSCAHGMFAAGATAAAGALAGDTNGAVRNADAGWALAASGANLPTGNAARTVELWVRTTASAGWLAYYGNGFGLYLNAGNQVRLHRSWNCCSDYRSATAPRAINDGAWHHIAVTYGSGTATWYLDGQAFSSQGTSLNTALSTGLTAGALPGDLDEIAIFPRQLSAAEVASHFALASKRDTAVELTAAPEVWPPDGPVTFTARVVPDVGFVGTPTGTVTFHDGSTVLGTVPLSTEGTASLEVVLPPGNHSVRAAYSGDDSLAGSTSPALEGVVEGVEPVSVALVAEPAATAFGDPITFTATVDGSAAGAASPTGFVTFVDESGHSLATVALEDGQAVLATGTLHAGAHLVTARYGGDLIFRSGAATASVEVSRAPPTVSAIATPSPSAAGQTVRITVTVAAPAAGSPAPSGQVTVRADGDVLGHATLDPDGTATVSTDTLALGDHVLSAEYPGDADFEPASSAPLPHTVAQATTLTRLAVTPRTVSEGTPVELRASVTATGGATPTGTVTFLDGSAVLAAVELDGAGSAVVTSSSFALGSHSLRARYEGDDDRLPSTSGTAVLTVRRASSVELEADPAQAVFGQPVALRMRVTPGAAGDPTPTGTVTFRRGSVTIGTASLVAGVATLNTTSLPVGDHEVTGSYAGDLTYGPAAAGPVTVTVEPATTATAITSSPNPAGDGAPVTVVAVVTPVAPGGGVPTGFASFFVDGALVATVALDGAGRASYSAPGFAEGTYLLTATYGGSGSHEPSESPTRTQVVAGTTQTALASEPNPSVLGGTVRLTATVSHQEAEGVAAPTGSVSFFDGTVPLGSAPIGPDGEATLDVASLAVGSHDLTATYSGDSGWGQSTSPVTSHVVERVGTTTTLDTSPAASQHGQLVVLRAEVTADRTDLGALSGFVTFRDDTTVLGTVNLDSTGAAQLSTALPAGSRQLTAAFGGDPVHAPSTSPVRTHQVDRGAVQVTLSADRNPSATGQPVELTVIVAPVAPAAGTPSGLVTIYEGTVALGQATLADGRAVVVVDELTAGDHVLHATYSGDVGFEEGQSEPLQQDVGQATTLVLSSAPEPSTSGETVTLTAQVSSDATGQPTGTVEFREGTRTLGVVALEADGTASIAVDDLGPGDRLLSATYGGDEDFASSDGATTHHVAQGDTTVTLESSANPSLRDHAVTFTATVAVVAPATATPTGFVTFRDGDTTLGTVAVGTGGVARLTLQGLEAGSREITAAYGGDAQLIGSTSAALIQVVDKVAPVSTLQPDQNPVRSGRTLTVKAGFRGPFGGLPVATIELLDGEEVIASAPLDSAGIATFQLDDLTVGTHALTARFPGDTNYLPATTTVLSQVVRASVPSFTELTVTPNPAAFREPVTLAATVHSAGDATTSPRGFVTFERDGVSLGTAAVGSDGSATLTLTTIPPGVGAVRARYGGDTVFGPSASLPVDLSISAERFLTRTTDAPTATAGQVSDLITVRIGDDVGPVPAPTGGFTLDLGSTSPTGAFRTTSDEALTELVIPAGASEASFRYRDITAGAPVLTIDPGPSSGAAPLRFRITVVAGPLDHLRLSPEVVTAAPGENVSFTAEGLDAFGNSLGALTSAAVFEISPDGSCAGSTCSAASTGAHTITASVDDAVGSATLIGDHLPEITVTPDDPDGQAPHAVRFAITATDADPLDQLRWSIDFGDGSPVLDGGAVPASGQVSVEHTYLDECRACVVSVTVDDGMAQPSAYETTRVTIAGPAPLRADAGDPVATVIGRTVAFNGTRSTPAPPGIETYEWNFGDGSVATGPTAEHSFTAPGLYPVSLTVRSRGLASTDTVPVRVQLPPGPGLTVHLGSGGVPLTGGSVLVHDALGQAHPAQEIGGGEYVVPSLVDGEHTVYAFKSGFTPTTATATIVDSTGEISIDLVAGDVAVADLTTRRLTLEEAIELGVDPDAAGNQNTFQFSLNLSFNEEEVAVSGVASSTFHHVTVGGHACGCVDRIVVQGRSFVAVAYPAPDRLLWIIIPGQAKWLKEFFEAKLQVTNLAPDGFTLTEGQATIDLPHGLSLADVLGEPQQLSQPFPDVPGGASRDATWILRGDVEGFYDLEAHYTGVLDPVGEVVRLDAATDAENAIHVWGGSALNLEFEVDDHAYEGSPYLVRVKVRNVADVPAYNPMITMLPAPQDINRDYVFQPRQQFDMGTARIEPGEVFETGDYIVAPSFDGELNLAQSFVLQTGGNQFIEHTITTRPAPPPSLPRFAARSTSSGVQVEWEPVEGALGYQVFTTPHYVVNFPFAPVATAAASATTATLPYRPDGYGLVALSTLVPGPDGRPRNQLVHGLLDLGARVASPEDPCSAFGWSPFGSTVGNFTTAHTDLQVAVPGPALRHARTYNSLSTNVGWFGLGWSSDYEMRTSGDSSGNVVLQHPDGRCEMFVRTGEDLAQLKPVSGRHATLLADGSGGFRLIEADRTIYAFAIDGRLDSITDAAGRRQSLAYDGGGHLETVTDDSSGRRLHFTWDGTKVVEVATDPVTTEAGTAPLAWHYAYEGDQLVAACDPRDGCWELEHGDEGASSQAITTIRKPLGNIEWDLAYTEAGLLEQRTDGAGTTTRYEYPDPGPDGARTVRAIDAEGNVTVNEHDARHRLVRTTVRVDGEDLVTSYGYDDNGYRTSVTDALHVTASAVYDDRGNLLSRTDGTGATTYFEYDANDLLQFARDPRSASSGDQRFATDYDYNQFRQVVREAAPATASVPAPVTQRAYSAGQVVGETWVGTDPAVDGGVVPNSLLVEEHDPSGGLTTFRYDRFGDLREVTDPAGLVSTFTYDEIGRRRSETIQDPVHGPVTTTWTYDGLGQVTSTTGPLTTDPVTGASHRLRVTTSYDQNGNTRQTTGTDVPAGVSRTSSFTFDDGDRLVSATDPEGGVTSRTYGARGLVATVTDAEGRVTRTDYDERGYPVTETLLDFIDDPIAGSAPRDLVLERRRYDAVGRPTGLTDALGRTFRTTYDAADRVTEVRLLDFRDPDGSTRDVVIAATPTYDAAGRPVVELEGGGTRRVTNTWDEAGRLTAATLELGAVDRTEAYTYLPGGEVSSIRRSDPSSSDLRVFSYDAAGRMVSETVDDGAGGLTTQFEYDARRNLVREIDPRGTGAGGDPNAFATEYGYDAAGRPTRMTAPPVALDGSATMVRPESLVGWNAFDDEVSRRDPRGQITRTTLDLLGRIVRIDHPSYTTPAGVRLDPSEQYAYDRVGNLVSSTDRRGQTSDFSFDALNRVVRQLDPMVTGAAARGEARFAYDDGGNLQMVTDQLGAVETWGYDDLDRAIEHVTLVRRPSGDPLRPTTLTRYDDGGRPTSVIDPTGATTSFAHNGADEVVSQTDPLGAVTTFEHDHAGRMVRSTDPLGRSTQWTYDPAGRLVAEEQLDPLGAVLTRTAGGYDQAGNLVALTSPRGLAEGDVLLHTTTRTVDALGRVVAVQEPATPTTILLTRYGYDQDGNVTLSVDGRGNETRYSYQSWGLLEATVEPSTTAHPGLADRSFTTTYDAGGLPVVEDRPGVRLTRTFDELGRLTGESGAGAGVTSASRSFAWDLAGRVTSASHPTGTLTLAWDDRDLLTSATGPAGTSVFGYDDAGRLTRRTDASGTASFTWTARGELDTASDPLTGTTRDLTWDAAGQLRTIAHSSGGSEQMTYDDLGRLQTEELRSAAGAVLVRHAYGYDADGDLTSQTDTLPGNTSAGANSYGYDAAGRLTSWTAPGGVVTPYAYDGAGNRTQIGSQTLTYDQRNRLLTGPEGTFTWTARGTLATATSGTTVRTVTHDALDRLVADRSVTPGLLGDLGAQLNLAPPLGPTITNTTYAVDALDRVASRNGVAFSYAGLERDPVADGTATYGRGPTGELVAATVGTASSMVGSDAHGDVTHLWQAASGGTVTGTRVFDPLGRRVATTGTDPAVGFQGDFTDPTTGQVWMGARWYSPRSGVFAERDTWAGQLETPISLNRYTYGYANPRTWWDPDGHSPESDFWCGDFRFGPFFPGDREDGGGQEFDNPWDWLSQMASDLAAGNWGDLGRTFAAGARQGMSAAANMARQVAAQAYRVATNVARSVDLTNIHTVLDIAGFIPGVGAFADAANAILYAAEGDWVNAGISAGAILFDGATAARVARGAVDGGSRLAREGASRLAANVASGASRVSDVMTNGARRARGVVADTATRASRRGADVGTTRRVARPSSWGDEISDGGRMVDQPFNPGRSPGISNERPVVFDRMRGGQTSAQDAQMRAYADGCNEALCAGALSSTGRVSTKGDLTRRASRSAKAEKVANRGAYGPGQHAGHVPDTTWTGDPDPFDWMALDGPVNNSLGAQAGQYPIGYEPTGFWFIDDYIAEFGSLPPGR